MDVQSLHPIRKIREDYQLSQADLAVILDVPASFIGQIENGYSNVPERAIRALCRHFKKDSETIRKDLEEYREQYKQRVLARLLQPRVS